MNNFNTVFADYLSVTHHPERNVSDNFHHFCISNGYQERTINDEKSIYQFPDDPSLGKFWLNANQHFHQIEYSGLALAHLRRKGLLEHSLALLSEHPNSVTRLDLTMDRIEPFRLPVRRYKRKYSDDLCKHGKAILEMKYATRKVLDDIEGAIYFGDKKRRHDVIGIVYNKTIQMIKEYGIELQSNITRYEVKMRKRVGASLKDVADPQPLFYDHAVMFGMKRPKNVPEWVSGAYEVKFPPIQRVSPYLRLQRYLEDNSAFSRMLELAQDIGPDGHEILHSMLKAKIDRSS